MASLTPFALTTTPSVQQQLQHRLQQYRQDPLAHQHGQLHSLQYYIQHDQLHQSQHLQQQGALQQVKQVQQLHQLEQLDQRNFQQSQQLRHQQPFQHHHDGHGVSSGNVSPCTISLPVQQPESTAGASLSTLLYYGAPSRHLRQVNQDGRSFLANSALLLEMHQQALTANPSETQTVAKNIPSLYMRRSGFQSLLARSSSSASGAANPGRRNSGSHPSSSSLCPLAFSGSAASDTSTAASEETAPASVLAASLGGSIRNPTFQFSTTKVSSGGGISHNIASMKAVGREKQAQPHPSRQQVSVSAQQEQQTGDHAPLHVPQRQPSPLTPQQDHQRFSAHQCSTDREAAGTARQLRHAAAAIAPMAAAPRGKYSGRSTAGPQHTSSRSTNTRRVRHQVRQQHEQRAPLERYRHRQQSRQQSHCRCRPAAVQRGQQSSAQSEASSKAHVLCCSTAHLVPTGSGRNAVAFPLSAVYRATNDDLVCSVEGKKAPPAPSGSIMLAHGSHGLHGDSSSSASPLVYNPDTNCEASVNSGAFSRGIGLPPLPYLYYNLRFGGGGGWPNSRPLDCRQTANSIANTNFLLSRATSRQSFTDGMTRRQETRTLPSARAANPSVASPRLYRAKCGYPLAHASLVAASDKTCLLSTSVSGNQPAALAGQQAARSDGVAASTATAVAATSASIAGGNRGSILHRPRGRLEQNTSLGQHRGTLPPQNLPLTGVDAEGLGDTADCRDSAVPAESQPRTNRPHFGPSRSEGWHEQQPTVTLPLLCQPASSELPATPPLSAGIAQHPCSSLLETAGATLICGDSSITSVNARSLGVPNAAITCQPDISIQLTKGKSQAGDTSSSAKKTTFSSSLGKNFSPSEIASAKERHMLKTETAAAVPATPRTIGETCTCATSDHIGRGRGPGGTEENTALCSPVPASPAAAAGRIDDAARKADPAGCRQRAADLERTWLRLLCESEAVAEGKVRTCRSSAPIPPAILLRTPEKLEGHVISSSSSDVLKPPPSNILKRQDGVGVGDEQAGRSVAEVAPWLKNRKLSARSGTHAELCCSRYQAFKSDADKTGYIPTIGGAGSVILETLHLEKLLQSAIYGAVFRANMHTVFRVTRASKKAKQVDKKQVVSLADYPILMQTSLYARESLRSCAGKHVPCDGVPTAASAAARRASCNANNENHEDADSSPEAAFQQAPNDCFAEDSGGGMCHPEATGSIDIRSQVVAVKILSLSLQLSASPSLQEDFLSEFKFYSYLKGHKNILVPQRIFVDCSQQLLMLVFPFAEFEDLFEVLKKRKKPFPEAEVQWICKQLLKAVLFLHKRGIAMRDLSLENVLIFRCPETGFAVPKLTDPGQAVIADQEAATATRTAAFMKYDGSLNGKRRTDAREGKQWCYAVGQNGKDTMTSRYSLKHGDYEPPPVLLTPDKIFGKSFRPPEVYQQCSYNPFKVDSFCVGWMTYYLLTKQQLFQRAAPSDDNWRLLSTKNARDLLVLLERKNGAVLSVDGLDFVVRLLEDDPKRRMTIYQALCHPFIALSEPTPIVADKLFPDDAVADQQHRLKQRQVQMQLFKQRQSLLYIYSMQARESKVLQSVATHQEPPQEQEPLSQLKHRRPSPHSENALAPWGVHISQELLQGKMTAEATRQSLRCPTLLRKRTSSQRRKTSSQHQQELCKELLPLRPPQQLPKPQDHDSVHISSRVGQKQYEQVLIPQQPENLYCSECSAASESQPPSAHHRTVAAYEEEVPLEPLAPTLLVQHSAVFRRSPPTPSTPYRWWSADVPPSPQKTAPPADSATSDIVRSEEHNGYKAQKMPSDFECDDAIHFTKEKLQRLHEQMQTVSNRQEHFTAAELLQSGASVDNTTLQDLCLSDSLLAKGNIDLQRYTPRADQSTRVALAPASRTRPPAGALSDSRALRKKVARKKETIKSGERAVDVRQSESAGSAHEVVQIQALSVLEASEVVEGDSSEQALSKPPSAERCCLGSQIWCDECVAQPLFDRQLTQKKQESDGVRVPQLSIRKKKESISVAPLSSLSCTKIGGAERSPLPLKSETAARCACSADELALYVKEYSCQTFSGTEYTRSRSELFVQPFSSVETSNSLHPAELLRRKAQQTSSAPSGVKSKKSAASASRPKAVAEAEQKLSTVQGRAVPGKGRKGGSDHVAEIRSIAQPVGGQHESHTTVAVSTMKSGLEKGRRGPSSSSTDTGSTGAENCGGRSDSDYCVGMGSNGMATLKNASERGKRTVQPRITSSTERKALVSGSEHERRTSAGNLWKKSTSLIAVRHTLETGPGGLRGLLRCSRKHVAEGKRGLVAVSPLLKQQAVGSCKHAVGSDAQAYMTSRADIENRRASFTLLSRSPRDVANRKGCAVSSRAGVADTRKQHQFSSKSSPASTSLGGGCRSECGESVSGGPKGNIKGDVDDLSGNRELCPLKGFGSRAVDNVATSAGVKCSGRRTETDTRRTPFPKITPPKRLPSF